MGSSGGAASASGPPTLSQADELGVTHNNMKGYLELGPKYVRDVLDKECKDKRPSETYRAYLERLRGNSFTKNEWKTLCHISWNKIETSYTAEKFDLTALYHLYKAILEVKSEIKNEPTYKSKIRDVLKRMKDLRDKLMHNNESVADPGMFDKLIEELQCLIEETGNSYSLSSSEKQRLEVQFNNDINTGFSRYEKLMEYTCSRLLEEGRESMKRYVEYNFTNQTLPFEMGQVKRSDVFCDSEVMLRNGGRFETVPFSKIFEVTETIVIILGESGAGKSALIKKTALQFTNSPSGSSAPFLEFQLLAFVRCHDQSTKTLRDIVMHQFGNVCPNLDEDNLLEALVRLKILFLIDCYGEQGMSKRILREIGKHMWRTSWKVVICSRYHAVERLIQQLPGDKSSIREFEIAPLESLEQQLKFLAKYEPHIFPGCPAGALQATFRNLRPSLRSLFTEPLKLLKFCNVVKNFPGEISNWETPSDVAEHIYDACKDVVEKKLAYFSHSNLPIVVDDLFSVISNAALNFLRSNENISTKAHVKMIQGECLSMLRERHGIKGLNIEAVLSSVLKTRRPSGNTRIMTFSFNHETDQQYFASKSVVEKMDAGGILKNILKREESVEFDGGEAESVSEVQIKVERWPAYMWSHFKTRVATSNSHLRPFLKVLQHVARDLNTNSPSLLKQRWSELSQALQDAGADYTTLLDLVLACPSSALVVKWAAETARDERDVWVINNARDMAAVALMLKHAQPNLLSVEMRPQELEATCWPELVRSWNGDLRLWLLFSYNEWYTGYPNCDGAVAPLLNSRCHLVNFRGHLTAAQGVSAIASVASSESELQIWLSKPLLLDFSNMRCKSILVHALSFASSDEGRSSHPLAAQPPPHLIVGNFLQESWEPVVNTVLSLAPNGKRYGELTLSGCKLSDADMDHLLVVLQKLGIRTLNISKRNTTSTKLADGVYRLHITNKLPPRLERVRAMLPTSTLREWFFELL